MVVSAAFAGTIGSRRRRGLFQQAGNGMLVDSTIFALNAVSTAAPAFANTTTARGSQTRRTGGGGGGGYGDLGNIFVRHLVIVNGGQQLCLYAARGGWSLLHGKVARQGKATVFSCSIWTLLGGRYDAAAATEWISIDEGAKVIVLSDARSSRTSHGM